MKRIAVLKKDLPGKIRELTRNMSGANWFVNIQTKPHKDPAKIWIVIG